MSIDSGLGFTINGTSLAKAGDSVLLGQTPCLHADVSTQIVIPGGGAPGGIFSASFQFTTAGSQYQNSSPFTLKYTPTN
jgi:hypothetical protein